jgi:hypothetical protein
VGFDRSRVKGLVAKLIRLKQMETATAIEVAAGGAVCYFIFIKGCLKIIFSIDRYEI